MQPLINVSTAIMYDLNSVVQSLQGILGHHVVAKQEIIVVSDSGCLFNFIELWVIVTGLKPLLACLTSIELNTQTSTCPSFLAI